MKNQMVVMRVEVAAPVPVNRTFHYAVPEALSLTIKVGQRVLVPFGPRQLVAYVLTLNPIDTGKQLKMVIDIIDHEEETFPTFMVEFLNWMAAYYQAPPGEVFRGAHPSGVNAKSIVAFRVGHRFESSRAQGEVPPDALFFIEKLGTAPTAVEQIKVKATDRALKRWMKAGWLEKTTVIKAPRVEIRHEPAYRALAPAPLKPRGRGGKSLKRDLVWSSLVGRGLVARSTLRAEFGDIGRHLTQLVEEGAISKERIETFRDPFFGEVVQRDEPPPLNPGQKKAVDAIVSHEKYHGFLLHGITGSGKTEVYLRAIHICLERGQGALVLVPEIALTPQLVRRFRARLGDQIAILHSGLPDGVRYEQWRKVRRGEVQVAIGTRSGIFAPVRNLGLIIVDEEHDPSFKQGDGVRYNGRDMALVRGSKCGAVVVLGSATPSLESTYNAMEGKLTRLSLPKRATGMSLPPVSLVDLKSVEKPHDGDHFLSPPIRSAIEENLGRGEQTIVFLNRRGFSAFVLCTSCGETLECNRCDISMTWHKGKNRLHCHYCNAVRRVPSVCPQCQAPSLEFMGRGTERVEERLSTLFPEARIARLDRDTGAGRKMERMLGQMRRREIDILVGTQMVTKGHDFPFVTLVCVLDADAGLNFPDFRAAERTVQLLTQVGGRAGRAQRPGRVLIQTWDPEHFALQSLIAHDHAAFAQKELSERQLSGYPPFSYAAVIRVEGRNPKDVATCSEALAERLRHLGAQHEGCQLRGPAPAILERIRNRTRYALLVTAPSRQRLRRLLSPISAELTGQKEPRVIIDIDPYDLM